MVLVLVYVFSLNFVLAGGRPRRDAAARRADRRQLPDAAPRRASRPASGSARWARSSARRSAAIGSSRPTRWRSSRPSASTRANGRYFAASRQTMRLQALNSPLMEILAGIGLALVFVYAAGQIHAGRMTVGGLLSFLARHPDALQAAQGRDEDQHRAPGRALGRRTALRGHRRHRTTSWRSPTRATLAPFSRSIRYEGVRFAYEAEPVLDGRRSDDPRAARPWRSSAPRAPGRRPSSTCCPGSTIRPRAA